MSIELTTLSFKVDTKELETAITKVGELGDAVSKVNTPLAELAKNSKSAAKGAADFSASAEKAGKGAKKLADDTDAVDVKLQKLRDQLSFLRNDLNLSETGFTKMQAGVMSSMKAIGATEAQLKQFAATFDQFNKIMGEQALDKSVAGLNMLNRQMREFQMTNELAAKGFNLTSTQVKQLARDIEALQQQNQEFGRSATFGVDELTKKYVSAANSVNQYIAAAKESEQAAKREAQAAIESARATDANNAAIARQYELVRQSAWKEYAAGVGQTSNEIKALSSYYSNLQKETEQANAAIEKQFGMLRSSAWKEYSNSVGQTSDEMKKLNNYFREQEKAASDLEAQRFKALGVEQQVATTKKQIIDEATRSEQYLIKETEKLIFVNEKLAQGFSTASANALFKYQEALQKTGRTADQVEKELADLGKELMKKQGTSPISKMRGDIQQLDQSVNHLARNVGVQFTDIFVSLANGQSIFQVVTQQGGQLADAFLLAGISGKNMTNQLVEGAKSILASYKVLGSAFVDLVGRGINSASTSIVDFGSKITGVNLILNTFKNSIDSTSESGQKTLQQLTAFGNVFRTIVGGAVAGVTLAFTAMGVAILQVLKEQQGLNLAINTTGASLGLTKDSAIELTRSLGDIGVNTTNATAVLTELAKGGTLSAESFEYVAEAADKMQKYAGISIDKTVADFNKLTKDPAKNLAELAGKTGYVTLETLKYIQALQDEGKEVEAVQAAVEAMAEAKIKAAESAYDSASPLIKLWIDIKSVVSDAWSAFKDATAQGQGLAAIIRVAWETVAVVVSEVWYVLKMTGKEIGGIAAMISRVLSGDFAGAKSIWTEMGEDAKKARIEQDKNVKSIIEGVKIVQDTSAKERQENARNAASFEENEKKRKKALEESKRTAEQAAKEISKYYKTSLEKAKDTLVEATGKTVELTKAEKVRMDLFDDPLWKKLSENQQAEIKNILDTANSLELEARARKKVREEWEKTVKNQAEIDKQFFDVSDEFGKYSKELQDSSKELDFQYSIIGKTSKEAEQITREYQKQNKLTEAKSRLEEDLIKAQGDVELRVQAEANYAERVRQINKETALRAAEDYQKAFEEIQDTVADIISTALFEGGKAGQKKLKDVLKSAFRNFVIDVFINPITKNVGGSIVNALIGGSSGSSSFSSIGSAIGEGFNNYISSTAIGTLLSSSAGYAAAIGGGSFAVGSQAAMLAAQTGGFGAAGTALTAQAAGGTAGALGSAWASISSAMPYIAAATAVLSLFGGDLFGDAGTAHTGGVGSYSAALGSSYGQRTNTGEIKGWSSNVAFGGDAYSEVTAQGSAQLAQSVVTMLDSFATAFGQEAGYYVGTGFADDTSEDGAWGALLVKQMDNILVDWGRGSDKWPGREFANGEAGLKGYMTALATDVRDVLIGIAPDWADEILNSLGESPTIEQLSSAVAKISQVYSAFKALGDLFPQLANLSSEVQDGLLGLTGGVENLLTLTNSYYENFYSEAEKTARKTEVLTDAFASLGYTLPATREEFRSYVEALDLTTESGQKMYVSLLSLGNAFAELAPATEAIASTAEDAATTIEAAYNRLKNASMSAEDIAKERIDLEKELFYLVSDSATIREYERNQISATNRVLWDAVQAFKTMMPIIQGISSLRSQIAALENPETSSIEARKEAIESEISNIDKRLEVLKVEKDRLNDQLEAANRLLDASKSLKDFVDSLKVSELSSLSDTQKLGIYSADYAKQLSLAKTGDTEAIAKIQELVPDYLETIRNTSNDSTEYARQFLLITNELEGLATSGITSSQRAVDQITKEIAKLNTEEETLTSQKEALNTQLSDLNNQNSLQVLKDQLAIQEQLLFDTASQSLSEIVSTDNIALVLGALPADLASQLSALLLPLVTNNVRATSSSVYGNTGQTTNSQLEGNLAQQAATGGITVATANDAIVSDFLTRILPDVSIGYAAKARGYQNIKNLGYSDSAISGFFTSVYGSAPSITAELDRLRIAAGLTDIYDKVLGSVVPDEAGLAYWVNAVQTGLYTKSNIVDAMVNAAIANGQSAGINMDLAETYLPKFADGGYYSGGLALVGEEGPELINFSNPGQVYNASQTASMLGDNTQLISEIRELRMEVATLRADNNNANRQIALNTGVSKTTLRKWDDEGMPDVRI